MGRIELIQDKEFMLSIVNDPEFIERISEGQCNALSKDDINAMIKLGYVLGWLVDDVLRGFYWVHPLTRTILQIHAHFKKDQRQHARGSGIAMLDWLRENAKTDVRKFIAMIPDCYPDVIGFSLREGLAFESKLCQASLKGDKLHDVIIMGASR